MSNSFNPMDYSLPGSSIHRIFQARILEWVPISFSRGSSWLRDRTRVFFIASEFFTNWANREAPATIPPLCKSRGDFSISNGPLFPAWLFSQLHFKLGSISPQDWSWLPSFFLSVSDSPEDCWNLHGNCRDSCYKNEKVYVLCLSGKLCCVKPKYQPHGLPKLTKYWSPRAQKWRRCCPEPDQQIPEFY